MLYPPAVLDIAAVSRVASADSVRNALSGVLAELGMSARVSSQLVGDELTLVTSDAPSPESPAWQAVWLAQRGRWVEAHAALARAEQEARHARSTWAASIAVGELQCDDELRDRGARLLGLLRERFRAAGANWDPVYREQGLGDYQWAWDRIIKSHDPSPLWAIEPHSCPLP